MMKIPVFVSRPNELTGPQEQRMAEIHKLLAEHSLDSRTLGQEVIATDYPLKAVRAVARHCSGGLVLGFSQEAAKDIERHNRAVVPAKAYPTPWNHLEGGILFALQVPLLIWKEDDVHGGIFDNGVTDNFVHKFDDTFSADNPKVKAIFSKWQSNVHGHYYGD